VTIQKTELSPKADAIMLVENAICMNINLKEFDSKPQIKPQTIYEDWRNI